MKTMGGKLDIHIPDDILRAMGENARNLVNYCGLVVRTTAPLTTIDWKEMTDRVGEQMLLKIKVINLLLVVFIFKIKLVTYVCLFLPFKGKVQG